MNITRIDSAPTYVAPNHFGMTCLRLQGREAGPAEQMWMGMSIIEPGGYTTLDPSPMEKLYIVLQGELTLVSQTGDGPLEEVVLKTWDTARFAPGESRQLKNLTNEVVRVVITMPFEPPAKA
jgi:hypothetical protein